MVIMYRNYMLHMPFTHRSTLTMNTNRFRGRRRRDSFSRKHKRGLSARHKFALGNNPIFHLFLHHSFSMKWQKEFSQDHGIEGIKFFTHLLATTIQRLSRSACTLYGGKVNDYTSFFCWQGFMFTSLYPLLILVNVGKKRFRCEREMFLGI